MFDSTILQLSVYQMSRHPGYSKFLFLNLRKWTSPLRRGCENTQNGHKIHSERSPDGSREANQSCSLTIKTAQAVCQSARADFLKIFPRVRHVHGRRLAPFLSRGTLWNFVISTETETENLVTSSSLLSLNLLSPISLPRCFWSIELPETRRARLGDLRL